MEQGIQDSLMSWLRMIHVVRNTKPEQEQAVVMMIDKRQLSTITPTKADVICAKDKTFRFNPGNQIYDNLVTEYKQVYMEAKSKQERMEITKSIVSLMKTKHGAKFVRQTKDSSWEEMSEQMCRDKVSHALRFAIKHKSSNCLAHSVMKKHRSCPSEMTALTCTMTLSDESHTSTEDSISDIPEDFVSQNLTFSPSLLDSFLSSLDFDLPVSNDKLWEPSRDLNARACGDSTLETAPMLKINDIDELMKEPLFRSGEWSDV